MVDRTTGENAGRAAAEVHEDMRSWLADIERTLDEHCDVLDAYDVRSFKELAESVRRDGREKLEDGRLLRLGILGQVNAGKSSLLNLLLFGGHEVLPKAATPMTAALTHIVKSDVKSDRDEIEIEYFSEADWQTVEQYAEQYRDHQRVRSTGEGQARKGEGGALAGSADMPTTPLRDAFPEERAASELVEMVRDRQIDVGRHLGQKVTRAVSRDDLNRTLLDHVGAHGELTPLIKSVTIRCSQGIPDFDVVDTPGINDPIVSRCRHTVDLLGRCDAVLLLSYAGQFADYMDVQLFRKFRRDGIERRYLLASKFDSALIDVSRDWPDLIEAMKSTKAKLSNHASNVLRRPGDDEHLQPEEHILFVSTMCANLARKSPDTWSEDERTKFENLRKAYRDWIDAPAGGDVNEGTKGNLSQIGNKCAVDRVLENIRENKHSIMEHNIYDFHEEKRGVIKKRIEEMARDVQGKLSDLGNGDEVSIKGRIDEIDELVHSIMGKIEETWGNFVSEQIRKVNDFTNEIHKMSKISSKHIDDNIDKVTRYRRGEAKEGIWNWIKRLAGSDSGYEEETYEKEVPKEIEIQGILAMYEYDLKSELKQVADGLFSQQEDIDSVVGRMNRTLSEEISSDVAGDLNFDETRGEVRRAVWKVCGSVHGDLRKSCDKTCADESWWQMQSRKARDLETRKSYRAKALGDLVCVTDRARSWAEEVKEEMDGIMERARKELIPAAVRELESSKKRLNTELDDTESWMRRYELARKELERCANHVAR